MIKQCPRCKNEDINKNQNYCQVCGLDLRKEIAPEVPVQEQSKEVQIKIDGKVLASCLASYDKA